MSELVTKVAEILGIPETLVQRSAEARAEASGNTVEEVLQSWAGGEALSASTPTEEVPVEEVKEEVAVAEETPVEEVKEEVAVAEEVETVVQKATTKVETVIKKVSMANNTMGIKLNTDTTLPRWLNYSFMIIPIFILIGMVNTSGAQECGVNGILDVDRKSQQTVNCDGSPFEGKGVASTNTVNYVAVGQQVYSGAAACAGCHGANGGGGVGPSFIGGALYKTFPTCADHAKWIQLGSAGWQAEVGAAYGAENTISIGGMPGFQGKLTEEEIMAVVVFERVVFGGGNTEEVLIDCGLLETEEEDEENIEAVSTTP
jgi:mono/diheme cytochrome c family protein